MKQAAIFLEAFNNSEILHTGMMFVLVCAVRGVLVLFVCFIS